MKFFFFIRFQYVSLVHSYFFCSVKVEIFNWTHSSRKETNITIILNNHLSLNPQGEILLNKKYLNE